MFKKTKSLESGKKKIDLKIISSGYFKDFIVIEVLLQSFKSTIK